ncbi:MAG: hydantoin racemase [Prevotella sp.]|nr:MAG: hydantoin racemase [Prevotella sp.]
MAFGGRKGELVAMVGCGTSRLVNAKQVSNAT